MESGRKRIKIDGWSPTLVLIAHPSAYERGTPLRPFNRFQNCSLTTWDYSHLYTRLRREKWPQPLAPSFACPDCRLLGGASTSAARHATLLNGIASHVHYDSPVLISLQRSLPGLLIEMLDFETTASPLFGGPHVLMPLAFACSDELLAIERPNSN
jgi:hypothetical protein